MKNFWIFVAISGALAVIMGAMSAHALKDSLSIEDIARIQTAATYQMYHTLIIAVLTVYYQYKPIQPIKQSSWIFAMGIVMFSGSLYAYTFSKIHAMVFITPIGGMLFILGWLSLIRLTVNTDKSE
ncbi:DUF423 domain-containing protein [Candidatus Thioglobus sp.]|jgi:Uncharacterized small membrane protein|uniref:DUF423 domain-containing protein n=1 Tax=Candidatus Thioglobus sp. TaxID=2026721 RepID=UPI00176F33CD|nr:DUF423 domain-containing protein [Candidatus Thioglobus sp.]